MLNRLLKLFNIAKRVEEMKLEKLRKQALHFIRTNYPEGINEAENYPYKIWIEYSRLLTMYHSGTSVDYGWYSLIMDNLVDLGVSKQVASLLAFVRDEIDN